MLDKAYRVWYNKYNHKGECVREDTQMAPEGLQLPEFFF